MENNNKEKSYTLTINIAERGTELLLGKEKGDTSSVGHMWYDIAGGENDGSYGFAPAIHGQSSGPGKIYTNDSDNYATRYYQATIVINEEQYNTLAEFGKLKNLGEDKQFNFETDYKGLKNSCIDYTWKALNEVGINPKDFEGQMWPTHNADNVDEVLYRYTHSDTKNWNESLPDAGGYNATYGSKNDDIMSNGDKDGYLFGGAGYDTYKVNANDTIQDSDNQGQIYFNASLLSGVKHKVSEGLYEDAMFSYTEKDQSLVIAQKEDPSKSITIEDWDKSKKMLDIELSDEREEEKLDFALPMTGIGILPSEEVVSNEAIATYKPVERLQETQAEQIQTQESIHPPSVQAWLDQFTPSDDNVSENSGPEL